MEEAFAGATLGGPAELARAGDDVETDRFREASVGFNRVRGGGEFADDTARGQRSLHAKMNFAVALRHG